MCFNKPFMCDVNFSSIECIQVLWSNLQMKMKETEILFSRISGLDKPIFFKFGMQICLTGGYSAANLAEFR